MFQRVVQGNSNLLTWFILSLLLMYSHLEDVQKCDRKRPIFTESWGIINDGPTNYTNNSHCEWLIKANSTTRFVTLKFKMLATECSYDHIFVYDGDSYSSPLLGTFSGDTLPIPVTAQSGSMLILLYSDTNYVLKGFEAEYSITDCPLNCSGKGTCVENHCECNHLASGDACEIELCHNACGANQRKGQCQHIPSPSKCVCSHGYSGQSCSLPATSNNSESYWHLLSQEGTGLSPRAGHGGVYLDSLDRLYIFGGFSFHQVLGDFLAFDFNQSKWLNMTQKENIPSPRWGHAMAAYANNIVIFGGELQDGKLSNELWLYDTNKQEWKLGATGSKLQPPSLTKHSLTVVDEKWLYVFGGSYQDGSFSSDMYRINLKPGGYWEKIEPLGGKSLTRRLVGHSAIYYPPLKSLVVYGGISVRDARFSQFNIRVDAFHVEKKYWTELFPGRSHYHPQMMHVPLGRAFHTSSVIGNYMVVYGGYIHVHTKEEKCFDDALYFYHLECHKWVDMSKFMEENSGTSNPVPKGVFSHVASVRNGHTLVVVGGYNGRMRGDILAYVFPPPITSKGGESSRICSSYRSKKNCTQNSLCGWCFKKNGSEQGQCLEKSHSEECEFPCPGLCYQLQDCQSCLAWGEDFGTETVDLNIKYQPACGWCVQSSQCHPAKSPPPECQHTLNEAGGDVSWWGSQGTDIKSLSNCQIKDYPPGITLLSYHLHPDWNNPDNVSLLDKTTHSEWISRRPLTNHSIPSNEKVETIKLRGYIYPLNKNAKRGMFLTASPHLAVLRMSTDATWEHMEIVANVTTRETEVKVQRPNGQTLFPNFTRYQKYLLELEARHHIDNTHQSPPKVELSWSSSGSENKVITREHLEPYRNGSCGGLSTCMSCLSDAECGWCHSQNQCLNRNKRDSHRSQCFHNEELQFLVLKTEDCPLCSDFINCKDCTQQPQCEWIIKTATCVRSGSNDKSVRHTKLCPITCGSRLNCTSCLGNPGMCAWCEQTQTCFMFSTFTTSFMYGGCREWVDEDENRRGLDNAGGQCRNCSYHTNCRSCLNYLRCGWCGLVSNPTVGACVSGDYGGPDIGQCENILKHIHTNISELELAEWSYSTCPLVDECRLGLHDCHLNASCVDTKDSYNCTCNKGFRGDGVSFCNRTCLEECIHGHCSEVLDYQCTCEIGWTGSDCNTNCGCNNHSTCVHGVGLCDECRDLTEGKFCEKCSPGSYGNATSMLTGCKKCDCNEHGDVEKGICDNKTGTCYCVDNTIGKRCEKCAPGYYGNPISGGQCYRRCNPRSVSTDVKRGGLGVPLSTNELGHCLWIFTVYSSLNESSFQENRQGAGILLTIESDILISCYQNHIYVYDGLPKFLHPNRLRRELGTFCGKKQRQSIKVLATSGYLTVFYQHIDASQGFNATYHRVECPEFCRDPHRSCIDGRCQCKPGFVGPDCEEPICPNNCSSTRGYGACDETYGRCQCWGNYGRTNCSILLEPPYASWSVLFNPATARASSVPDLASVLPRMGHSLLTSRNPSLSNKGLIWVFGGYSTDKGELNDLYKFNTATSRWKEVVPEPQSAGPPPGRHFHGAAMTGNDIYVFGGLSKDRVLGDFWKFDTEKGVWTQLRTSSDVPPLSGLTLIAISDKSLLVIGGYSPEYGFLEYLLEYSLSSREWKILNSSGALPVGIYGHSSVYHSQTEAVYVFGGFLCDFNQVVVSDQLYAFHTPTLRWSRLPIDRRTSSARPMPRYFHAAATTAAYMIIIGGRTNNSELINDVFAYNYKCNSWGTLQLNSDLPDIKRGERIFIDVKIEGERPGPLSSLAAVWLESGFYVFGGYNGQTQGHLYQLNLPLDLCHLFTSSALACRKHTGCSYCLTYENGTNETFCFAEEGSILSSCSKLKNSEHNRGFVCSNDWLEQRNCSQYTNCTDCVAFWPAHYGIKQVICF